MDLRLYCEKLSEGQHLEWQEVHRRRAVRGSQLQAGDDVHQVHLISLLVNCREFEGGGGAAERQR